MVLEYEVLDLSGIEAESYNCYAQCCIENVDSYSRKYMGRGY